MADEAIKQAFLDVRQRMLMLTSGNQRQASGLLFALGCVWSMELLMPVRALSDRLFSIWGAYEKSVEEDGGRNGSGP